MNREHDVTAANSQEHDVTAANCRDRDVNLAILQQGNSLFDQWLNFWRTSIEPLLQSHDKEIGSLALENIMNVSVRVSKIHQECVSNNYSNGLNGVTIEQDAKAIGSLESLENKIDRESSESDGTSAIGSSFMGLSNKKSAFRRVFLRASSVSVGSKVNSPLANLSTSSMRSTRQIKSEGALSEATKPFTTFTANWFTELDDIEKLNLKKELLRGIEFLKMQLSLVQRRALIPLVQGRHGIIQSPEGSGNGVAYVIASLQKLDPSLLAPQIVICTPNRQSALKIVGAFRNIGEHIKPIIYLCNENVNEAVTARNSPKTQSQIIVGQPNQLRNLLSCRALDARNVSVFVLDHAHELLHFHLTDIFRRIPDKAQTIVSATEIPLSLMQLCGKYLRDPACILVSEKEHACTAARGKTHQYIDVRQENWKLEVLRTLFTTEEPASLNGISLVLCRNSNDAGTVSRTLFKTGLNVFNLKNQSNEIPHELLESHRLVLVSTILALRTMTFQLKGIQLVVNYYFPESVEEYLLSVRQLRPLKKGSEPAKIISLFLQNELSSLNACREYLEVSIDKIEINSLGQKFRSANRVPRMV